VFSWVELAWIFYFRERLPQGWGNFDCGGMGMVQFRVLKGVGEGISAVPGRPGEEFRGLPLSAGVEESSVVREST